MLTDILNRKPFIFYIDNFHCDEDEIMALLNYFEFIMKRASIVSASKLCFILKQAVPKHSILHPFTLTMERHLVDSKWQWHGVFKHEVDNKTLHVMGLLLEQ